MRYFVVLFMFLLGYVAGMYSGHITVIKDDGTVCAEVK